MEEELVRSPAARSRRINEARAIARAESSSGRPRHPIAAGTRSVLRSSASAAGSWPVGRKFRSIHPRPRHAPHG